MSFLMFTLYVLCALVVLHFAIPLLILLFAGLVTALISIVSWARNGGLR